LGNRHKPEAIHTTAQETRKKQEAAGYSSETNKPGGNMMLLGNKKHVRDCRVSSRKQETKQEAADCSRNKKQVRSCRVLFRKQEIKQETAEYCSGNKKQAGGCRIPFSKLGTRRRYATPQETEQVECCKIISNKQVRESICFLIINTYCT
jgi:hypothetical protein